MEEVIYGKKNSTYFLNSRKDLIDSISLNGVKKVLDVGCGSGATLSYIKSINPKIRTIGVEPFCEKICDGVDEVYQSGIEKFLADNSNFDFDLVLCLDVLEHIWDYQEVLSKIQNLMSENGKLIISVPNISNFRSFFQIFLVGNFPKYKEGIFDETHCRWFTKKVLRNDLENLGFTNLNFHYSGMERGKPLWYANLISLGVLQRYLGFQVIASAEK